MAWDERKNRLDIMRANINRDPVGSKLTPEAKERAAEFAADVWAGQMGSGDAARIGIKHVTKDVLK